MYYHVVGIGCMNNEYYLLQYHPILNIEPVPLKGQAH